MFNPSNF